MSKHILLVEDDPSDEKLTLMAFRRQAFASEIVVARDGAEALDYIAGTVRFIGRDASGLPGVTLLDLGLPRIDGLEVLRRLRADPRAQQVAS